MTDAFKFGIVMMTLSWVIILRWETVLRWLGITGVFFIS